jgi:hypothetical protein
MNVVAIGGSDAGITAALRARELDPSADAARRRTGIPPVRELPPATPAPAPVGADRGP